jgi:Tfp pilus assembly protein PilE
MKTYKRHYLSLIEVMITMVLIGVLVAVITPTYQYISRRRVSTQTELDQSARFFSHIQQWSYMNKTLCEVVLEKDGDHVVYRLNDLTNSGAAPHQCLQFRGIMPTYVVEHGDKIPFKSIMFLNGSSYPITHIYYVDSEGDLYQQVLPGIYNAKISS